jgi:hypothetical protein
MESIPQASTEQKALIKTEHQNGDLKPTEIANNNNRWGFSSLQKLYALGSLPSALLPQDIQKLYIVTKERLFERLGKVIR